MSEMLTSISNLYAGAPMLWNLAIVGVVVLVLVKTGLGKTLLDKLTNKSTSVDLAGRVQSLKTVRDHIVKYGSPTDVSNLDELVKILLLEDKDVKDDSMKVM